MKKILVYLSSILITTSSASLVASCSVQKNVTNNAINIKEVDGISELIFTNNDTKISVLSALQQLNQLNNLNASDVYITIQKSTFDNDGYVEIEASPGSHIVSGNITKIISKMSPIPEPEGQKPIKLVEYSNTLNLNLGNNGLSSEEEISNSFFNLNKNLFSNLISSIDFRVFEITKNNAKISGSLTSKYISKNDEDAVIVSFGLQDPIVPNEPGEFEQNGEGYYYIQDIPLNSYYSKEKNLEGEKLMTSLHSTIKKGFKQQSYSYVTTILKESDKIIGKNKLNGIYNGVELDVNANNTQWNKEHVWPKSRLHSSNTTGPGADAHNLRASQISINSTRGNDYFSEDSNKGEAHSIANSKTFYPGDESKGDVARIGFYMATMYSDLGYQLTNDTSILNSGKRKYMGTLDLLLKWNKEDPVDAFEVNRNNVIYKYQKNRNPYIDHPEFVHLIWENKTISDLSK